MSSHIPGQATAPRTGSSQVQRLDVLTSLRWFAAFGVFLFHMRVLAPLPGPITHVFDYGYLGVTFFFVLSGFVLTWSMRPQTSTSTFYWRRFARIYPSHFVALLLAVPVFYTVSAIPEGSFLKPFDLPVLLLSVVLLQGWSPDATVLFSGNPAAWTLTVEMLFYALFPLLVRPLRKRGVGFALGVAVFALVWAFGYRLAVTLWPASWLAFVPMPVTRVPEFLLGMALAWAMRLGWRPAWLRPWMGLLVTGVLFAAVVLAVKVQMLQVLVPFTNELCTVAVGLLIAGFAAHSLRGKHSWLEHPVLVKLGEWSFAFYLVHGTVLYGTLALTGYHEPSWLNLLWFAGVCAVALVAAWLLHSVVERPLERRMRRWKDRRDSQRSS